MTYPWLALHLFHAGDQDQLLLDAIQPALNRLVAQRVIARYFFIRYWNGGPHLRVRMECLASAGQVEGALRVDLERYLQEFPGGEPDPVRYEAEAAHIHRVEEQLGAAAVGAVEPPEPLQPADSIQTRQYHFDEQRYGKGFAESDFYDHAWASSRLAFAVLEVTRGDRALTQAFALHATAIAAGLMEAGPTRSAMLFEQASRWDLVGGGAVDENRWKRFGFLPFEAQRSNLDSVVRLLMNNRSETWPDYWHLLLQGWQSVLKRLRECLIRARHEQEIGRHPDLLLLDALHLLCNRLGLGLTSECYVYYLIAGLLKESGPSALPDSKRRS